MSTQQSTTGSSCASHNLQLKDSVVVHCSKTALISMLVMAATMRSIMMTAPTGFAPHVSIAAVSPQGGSAASSPVTRLKTIAEQDEWIERTFQASDPSTQEWCQRVLKTGTYWKRKEASSNEAHGAQYSQDIFVFRNVFVEMAMAGNKGFYVEAGANHYRTLSTTYFYDKCLGWDGLCVEPQLQYHADLTKHRSCKLVTQCLTKDATDMMLGGMPAHRGGGMYVKPLPPPNQDGSVTLPKDWTRIQCAPLHTILEEHASGRQFVDLFVLDVEGAEMMVLEAVHWDQVTFGALLIEDDRIGPLRRLDFDMAGNGYSKMHQMKIDALYVKQGSDALARSPLWYPPKAPDFDWKGDKPALISRESSP
jgi:hypothetical protein